jgi:phage terminase large subunit-like protein
MMEFWFDSEAGDRAVRFFQTQIRLVEGQASGIPFVLQPWQAKIVRDIFGWKRTDGTRRYRTVYLEVPRKNGKSTLAAALSIYLLLCDGEQRPQVYSAAGDRGQARIVFDAARAMAKANDRIMSEVRLLHNRVLAQKTGGWYEALSAEAFTKHGLSASGIIFDELHVQKSRELWDVLTTSVGARRQPLVIAITTAGHDRSSICWEMHQRARAALDNPEADPFFYPAIFGAADNEEGQPKFRREPVSGLPARAMQRSPPQSRGREHISEFAPQPVDRAGSPLDSDAPLGPVPHRL